MLIRVMLVGLAFSLLAPAAMAADKNVACPQRPAGEGLARDLAGDYFQSAERAFKKELFDESLARFICSLRLVEHENTVFNIAHVTAFVADKRAALRLFYAYVEDHPKRKTSAEIKEIIAELEERLSKEGPEGRAGGAAGESFGESEKKATNDVAKEGIKMSEVVDIASWTSIGLGGASLIVAVILQGVAVSAKRTAENATTYNDFVEARDKYDNRQAGAVAMFVTAGIFGGAGAVLMLWDKGILTAKTKTDVTLSFAPGPSGIALIGRF